MKTNVEVGDIIEVGFDDHCMNSDELLNCTAYGRVHSINDTKITLDSWHPTYDIDRQIKDNTECFTIVRATITALSVLGYTDDHTPEDKNAEETQDPEKDRD